MSEKEGLWYEISLTNRQVLVAFLVMLACVVGAFLSGVWVGREASPEVRGVSVADSDLAGDGAPFEFFGDEGAGGEGTDGLPPAGDTESVAATQRPSRQAREPEVRRPRSETRGSESRAGEPVLSETDVIIQVFSSQDRAQAQQVLGRLRGSDFPAFLSPVAVNGQTMYRVRVGPFPSRESAEAPASRIRQSLQLDTWITGG